MKLALSLAGGLLIAAVVSGCASEPKARQTGFLSDYSNLHEVKPGRFTYVAHDLLNYHSFIVEPLQYTLPPGKLNEQQRRQVADYFDKTLREVIRSRGYGVTNNPGPDIARIRINLTGVTDATWWMKIHPGMRMSGAGTGGAAMEGEVLDSITGEQLGAVVQASPGNQFNFTAFSTVDDIKSAIDRWAVIFGNRLDDMRYKAKMAQ